MVGENLSLKEKLIHLMDNDERIWVKSAFYSDPEVEVIVKDLYRRWENSDKIGIPLDYADSNELSFLWKKASKYLGMSEEDARALVFSRMMSDESNKKRRLFPFI